LILGFFVNNIIKYRYKQQFKKIKKENPGLRDSQAIGKILGSNKNRIIKRVRIVVLMFIVAAVTTTIAITVIASAILRSTSVIQYIAITSMQGATGDVEELPDFGDDWDWQLEDNEEDEPRHGGIYPVDRSLRLRAELLNILRKSSEDAYSITGNKVEAAWLLGTIFRETGNDIFNEIDNSNIFSLYTNLLYSEPVCGKEDCNYIDNRVSHFVGGSVVNGRDTGNPANQLINTSREHYDNFAVQGIGHAIGFVQFEIPYIYTHLKRLFNNTDVVITDPNNVQKVMDAELGFIRPNIFFVPDAMYNSMFLMAEDPRIGGGDKEEIINSPQFRGLSERNRRVIKFVYASSAYGRGRVLADDDIMARRLIDIAQDTGINLDEMLLDIADRYWNDNSNVWRGSMGSFKDDARDYFGVQINRESISWYGLFSANIGRLAYVKLKEAIEAAEKEEIVGEIGNWVGRPGSGKFGGGGSEFYLPEVGIRWYHQTHGYGVHSRNWGNLLLNGFTRVRTPFYYGDGWYRATMASGGCGIYTVAMIASNLLNKDITPDKALTNARGIGIANLLPDSSVAPLARSLGLDVRTENYKAADFADTVKRELRRGNMILFVSQSNVADDFEWYTGGGHFMAIRGITDDNKLLVISSVGNSDLGLDHIEVMDYQKDISTWVNHMSNNRDIVWIMGVKGNVEE